MRRNLEFAGKMALITAGNGGIGAATPKRLAGPIHSRLLVLGFHSSKHLVRSKNRNYGGAE